MLHRGDILAVSVRPHPDDVHRTVEHDEELSG